MGHSIMPAAFFNVVNVMHVCSINQAVQSSEQKQKVGFFKDAREIWRKSTDLQKYRASKTKSLDRDRDSVPEKVPSVVPIGTR